MRSRGIQIGNAAREQLKTTDKNSANYTRLQELAGKGSIAGKGPLGWVAGKLAKKAEENAAAAKEAEVDGTPVISATGSAETNITNTSSDSLNKAARLKASKERLDARIEQERKDAAEAAEKARQAQAAQARASSAAQARSKKSSNDNGNGGNGGGGTGVGAGTTGAGTDGSSSSSGGKKSGGGTKSGPSKGDLSSERSKNEAAGGYSGGGKYGGFNKGGLIKKPKTKSYANGGYVTANEPAKKKKRKGLGTRP